MPVKAAKSKLWIKRWQYLKPPRFDGTASLKSFLVKFQNCATFSEWNEEAQLAFLRRALDQNAVQILWDYSKEEVNTVAKLTKKLCQRFGDASQP